MAAKKNNKPADPPSAKNAVRVPANDIEPVKEPDTVPVPAPETFAAPEPDPAPLPPPAPPLKIRLTRTFGVLPGQFSHIKGRIARAGIVIVNPDEKEKDLVKIGWAEVVN